MANRSRRTRTTRLVRRTVSAVSGAVFLSLVASTTALAVPPNPSPDGSAPGAALMNTVLGWLKWGALAASLAGLLIGAIATAVGHFGSNYSASSARRAPAKATTPTSAATSSVGTNRRWPDRVGIGQPVAE